VRQENARAPVFPSGAYNAAGEQGTARPARASIEKSVPRALAALSRSAGQYLASLAGAYYTPAQARGSESRCATVCGLLPPPRCVCRGSGRAGGCALY